MSLIGTLDRVEAGGTLLSVSNIRGGPRVEFYDKTGQRPAAHRDKNLPGCRYAEKGFDFDMAGSGSAGTAPPDSGLLAASSLVEVISAGVSVTYTPSPTYAHTPIDIDHYKGNGLLESCNNGCFNVSWLIEPGNACIVSYDGVGTYAEPTSGSGAGSLATSDISPVCIGLTATIAGITIHLKRLLINLGIVTSSPNKDAVPATGVQNPEIVDRQTTFEFDSREVVPSTKNWANMLTSGSKVAVDATLGSDAGNIAQFLIDGYAHEDMDRGVVDEFHQFTYKCRESNVSGDQQFQLQYT